MLIDMIDLAFDIYIVFSIFVVVIWAITGIIIIFKTGRLPWK